MAHHRNFWEEFLFLVIMTSVLWLVHWTKKTTQGPGWEAFIAWCLGCVLGGVQMSGNPHQTSYKTGNAYVAFFQLIFLLEVIVWAVVYEIKTYHQESIIRWVGTAFIIFIRGSCSFAIFF